MMLYKHKQILENYNLNESRALFKIGMKLKDLLKLAKKSKSINPKTINSIEDAVKQTNRNKKIAGGILGTAAVGAASAPAVVGYSTSKYINNKIKKNNQHGSKQHLKEYIIYIPSKSQVDYTVDKIKQHPKKSAAIGAVAAGALAYGMYKGNKKQKERWDKYGCSIEYYQDQYDRCLRYMEKKKR